MIVIALGMASLGGCLPEHLVWLPDSSGFVYTVNNGHEDTKVVRYDVGRRASRVLLLNDIPAHRTVLPGMSPDGKRIALVRVEQTKERQTAQVILVGIDGEVIRKSAPFPFGSGDGDLKEPRLREAVAEWSPKGDHVLISIDIDVEGPTLGVYDVKADKFTHPCGVDTVGRLVFPRRLGRGRWQRVPRRSPEIQGCR